MAIDRERQILVNFGKRVVNIYKHKLASNNVNSSGKLSNVTFTTTLNKSLIRDGRYEIIFNIEDYWIYVENGRKAGKFPPVNAIKEWIKQKPINPSPIQLKNGKLVTPTENQLAFLIGRKIKDEGIKARPYVKESFDEAYERQDLIGELTLAIAMDAVDELKNSK